MRSLPLDLPQVFDQLRFSFLTLPAAGGADSRPFTIDERQGLVRSRQRVDREALCPPGLGGAATGVGPGADQRRWNDHCYVRFDVAVQPILYIEIIKVEN